MLPAACTPTRPIYKIGLIAPFEGLYRRTGYEALLAMRSALSEYPNPQVNGVTVDLLPLAQNDNHLPESARRIAQKMLLDESVQGVIGPFSPGTAQAVGEVFAEIDFTWAVPFVVNPDVLSNGEANLFALPSEENAWASELLQAIARQSQSEGTQRLLLAGGLAGWPQLSEEEWGELLEMSVAILAADDVLADVLQDGDAVIWLGNPDAAAAFFAKLRPLGPDTPFWMGPQGGDPTFFGRTLVGGPVYWATWGDDGYEEWQASHEPATPFSYLVYRATQYAVSQALDDQQFVISDSWEVQFYQISQDGRSNLISDF